MNSIKDDVPPLEFTGERMIPEVASGEIFWEHVCRYRFATQHVKGRDVLDIACGEGYGTAALGRCDVRSIIGVDVSAETVEHARTKYGIDARVGDAEAIPLDDRTVDTVVSFETIEHVSDPRKFLKECWRVLRPGGTLVISTPNKDVYDAENAVRGNENPFHISEMALDQFLICLSLNFEKPRIYSQRPRDVPRWSVRWLATEQVPYRRLHFLLNVRKWLRSRLIPAVGREMSTSDGVLAIREIRRSEGMIARAVNEFAVRPASMLRAAGRPTYYVVVARSKAK